MYTPLPLFEVRGLFETVLGFVPVDLGLYKDRHFPTDGGFAVANSAYISTTLSETDRLMVLYKTLPASPEPATAATGFE